MSIYEIILDIIDKKGPATIPSILQDMNELNCYQKNLEKPIQLSQVKAAISRKKDLFSIENNVVSIHPEKDLVSLSATVANFGKTYRIKVDFVNNTFQFYQFYFNHHTPNNKKGAQIIGSVEEFKKEIYRMKIWNWEKDYNNEENVLGGVNWEVKLETKAAKYGSGGFEKTPKEWSKFCRSISKLIGTKFIII